MKYDRKTKTTRVEFEHSINSIQKRIAAALYAGMQHPCHETHCRTECNSRMILFVIGKRRILD